MTDFIKRNEDLFKVLAAFIASQLCCAALTLMLMGFVLAEYISALMLNVICAVTVNVAVFWLICGRPRSSPRAEKYSWYEPLLFFFAGVFLACLAGMLTQLLPTSEGSTDTSAGAEVLLLLYTAILAPIAEEIVFRGVVLTALSKRHKLVSALISAVLFAASHMSLDQLAYTFVLGFFLALLAQRSGRLLPCILVHSANNLLTLAAGYSDTVGKISDIALPVLGTISLALLIFTGRLGYLIKAKPADE